MHAFLANTNLNKEEVIKRIDKGNPTYFEVTKISEVRDLKSFLKFPPNTPSLIVITSLDKASIEAQNSMLKLIEEPGSDTISFLFLVENEDSLIDTILSRVQRITMKREKTKKIELNFGSKPLIEQAKILEKMKDREETINFLKEIVTLDPDIKVKESALKAVESLKSNSNLNLTLLTFLVNIH